MNFTHLCYIFVLYILVALNQRKHCNFLFFWRWLEDAGYLTSHNGCYLHSFCCERQNCVPFDCWMVFQCVYVSYLLYPINSWWADSISYFGGLGCCKYGNANTSYHACISFGYISLSVMAGTHHGSILQISEESPYCLPYWLYKFIILSIHSVLRCFLLHIFASRFLILLLVFKIFAW